MNLKNKKIFLSILATTMIISGFTGCNDKETIVNNDNVLSGENQKYEDNLTYNNGGFFVQYKGKTYYREYTNTDIEESGVEAKYNHKTDIRHSKYINAILSNGRIENIFEDDGFGEFYILDDRFYMSGFNNKIYTVDMKGENYIEFCSGVYVGADEENHKIYYRNANNNNALYSVDTQNLKITKLNDETVELDSKEEEFIYDVTDGFSYFDKNGDIKIVESKEDMQKFKNKYIAESGDENILVKVSNVEFVGEKIYYLLELSKYNSTGTKESYERIASEVYMYNTNTYKKVLLYLYKVSDKKEQVSGDINDLPIIEEPLAENEMYLNIKLTGKGLKDTFQVRVEEAGGGLLTKRIEYEGTHSSSEEMLKIKVTKEVGAMLTVYIDDEVDSQMIIEE